MTRLALGLNPFLTIDVINRCKEAKIFTILDFLSVSPETLSQQLSIPYKDIASIRSVFLGTYSAFAQTGASLYEELLQCCSILSTGCPKLDKFLNGGVYAGEVTEIHGSSGAGKTQLCLSIIVSLMAETESTSLYLDSNGGLSVNRLKQILLKKMSNLDDVDRKLQMLRVIYVHDVYNLFDVLHSLRANLVKQDDVFFTRVKLLVLDALPPLFIPCFSGDGYEGSGLLTAAAQQLKTLCKDHAISVVVCNNMGQSESSVKQNFKHYWSYTPSVTLCLRKAEKECSNIRWISLVKSCRQEILKETSVAITEEGILTTQDA